MIIGVIGKRYSGQSTVADYIHSALPQFERATAQGYALQSFFQIHDMNADDYYHPHMRELNRRTFGIFIDHLRQKTHTAFLNPLKIYLENAPYLVLSDIHYFNELAMLIDLRARLIWVECSPKLREMRYGSTFPADDPLEQEIGLLDKDLIRTWPNTTVIHNDSTLPQLQMYVRDYMRDIQRGLNADQNSFSA